MDFAWGEMDMNPSSPSTVQHLASTLASTHHQVSLLIARKEAPQMDKVNGGWEWIPRSIRGRVRNRRHHGHDHGYGYGASFSLSMG